MTEEEEQKRTAIRNSFRGSCGSCGMLEFVGLYKIKSSEYAHMIREEAGKSLPSYWSTYVICASSPSQTDDIKEFMLEAGWKIINTFKQAHADGEMTLWGVYALKPEINADKSHISNQDPATSP